MRGAVSNERDHLPKEGAFLARSLWLAQVCHLQGGRDDARELFESVLALRNDVSLLAEEY
jgi:hypothetical protein